MAERADPANEQLIAAIHDDRLASWLDSSDAKTATGPRPESAIVAADATTRAIGALARREATRLLAALRDPDHQREPVHGDFERIPDRLQRPTLRLTIAATDLSAAIERLSAAGYQPWLTLGEAALGSYRRVNTELAFSALAGDGAHLVVRWERHPIGRLPRRIQPNPAEWQLDRVPVRGWPVFHVLRLCRPVRRRRGRPSAELGPHLPTPLSLVEPLLAHAGVTEHDTLVDVGCGDGRVLIEAARSIGCRGIGIDTDAALLDRAGERSREDGLAARLRFVHGDATVVDLRGATAAFVFLPATAVPSIVARLRSALPAAAPILTHEQSPLPAPVGSSAAPSQSTPIFARDALTVAHLWP